MGSGDQASIAFYDSEAERYAARAHGKPEPTRLASFASRLPPGATILDLGCGGGQDSLTFLKRGFNIIPVDASPGIAAEAERRTGLKVRVQKFHELDDQATFDGIWAQASLHHVPAAELPDIFARMNRALRHGGLLYASFKTGETDRRDRLGRLYCRMNEALLRSLVGDRTMWNAPAIEHGKGSGYDNEPSEWLFLTVHRA